MYENIRDASDEQILSIGGIGRITLMEIRAKQREHEGFNPLNPTEAAE